MTYSVLFLSVFFFSLLFIFVCSSLEDGGAASWLEMMEVAREGCAAVIVMIFGVFPSWRRRCVDIPNGREWATAT